MIDPETIQAFELWYQKMKVEFLEHKLPAPHKKEVLRAIIRTIPHFINIWVLDDADLGGLQAWRAATKEATKEELRVRVTEIFNRRVDKLVENLMPLIEKALEEKQNGT
jgi:hypothetical protein